MSREWTPCRGTGETPVRLTSGEKEWSTRERGVLVTKRREARGRCSVCRREITVRAGVLVAHVTRQKGWLR
jgi:hypothetical protein